MNEHGLLLIDKPSGITSHDVVGRVRRVLKKRNIGHAGTLDPLATGLMVLLIGEATKLSDYILNGDKSYWMRVEFGVETDTWDKMGQISYQNSVHLNPEDIKTQAEALVGVQKFLVPQYSAVKVQGSKLYELARKNQPIKAPEREMYFYNYQTLEVGTDYLEAKLSCHKGGYIRSWAWTLGQKLGVGGIVAGLRRIESTPYHLHQALALADIEKLSRQGESVLSGEHFIPISEALPQWKTIVVTGKEKRLVMNGQIPYDLSRRLIYEQKQAHLRQENIGVKVLDGLEGQLLLILEAEPNKGLKIRRKFNI